MPKVERHAIKNLSVLTRPGPRGIKESALNLSKICQRAVNAGQSCSLEDQWGLIHPLGGKRGNFMRRKAFLILLGVGLMLAPSDRTRPVIHHRCCSGHVRGCSSGVTVEAVQATC